MAQHDNLTTAEAADYLRQGQRTLLRWRALRIGPPWCKAGQRVLYRKTDIDAWLEAQRRTPVRERVESSA